MNGVNTILFPSSFFDGKKVDEDLQSEYEAVLNTALWNTISLTMINGVNVNIKMSERAAIEQIRVLANM